MFNVITNAELELSVISTHLIDSNIMGKLAKALLEDNVFQSIDWVDRTFYGTVSNRYNFKDFENNARNCIEKYRDDHTSITVIRIKMIKQCA